MKKISLFLFAMVMAVFAYAQDFSIDLTVANPTLPAGVTQVSYPSNGAYHHGNQHGWCWYAFTFDAAGPVKITLGGCQYINDGYEGYVEVNGTKVGDIANKTAACYDANPDVNIASYTYTGDAATITVYCGQYCPYAAVETFDVNAPVEKEIVNTRFADWANYEVCTDKGAVTEHTDSLITKRSKEKIYFYMHNTNVYTGGAGKVSATCSAPDKYICGMKQDAGDTATITTSAFASITTMSYFHRATGNDRGWGLRVKGDGDTDWVVLYDTKTNSSGTNTGDIAVNRTNVVLQWFNLSIGNYAALTNLVINGMVADTRTFQNFELDFRNITELPEMPAGVTSMVGTPRNDAHGLNSDFQMVVPVDGAVKFTFGGCQYANNPSYVEVRNAAGAVLTQVDIATPGCYHNGGTATWTYNSEDADVLTIIGAQYNPYIKAEKTDFIPDIVISYRDQNKNLLGKDTIAPGLPFVPSFGAADLTLAQGEAFRGWVNAGGVKYNAGRVIDEDTELFALVSDIEYATVGSHYVFDLKQSTFYFEDHELIDLTGGKYNGKQHGWQMNGGERLSIVVSPKAYVNIGMCTYSPTGNQVIRNAAGDSVAVMEIVNYYTEGQTATADGAICSFFYENAAGVQDTITIDFDATSYIHQVEVYNVAGRVAKDGKRYNIPANDGATLMMVLGILEKGDTVYCPNGLYDFGETALTAISADSCVLMGESMEGTIIRNAPAVENEGIGTTATILNTSTGLVIKDLTIQNALDYYAAGSAGRAVTLWDKGDKTACYRVKLLSYQDTYYSNHIGAQMYFEDCEIHGTVDYICGDASVYFYKTVLFCEPRSLNGSGQDCITASNANEIDKGYVFDRCTIKSACPTVSLGRAWNYAPKTAYLLTTFDQSAGNFSINYSNDKGETVIKRWTINGMNALPTMYGEYKSMDVEGNVISPESNVVTFNYNGTVTMETILGYEDAEALSYAHFFNGWDPAENYEAFPEETAEETVPEHLYLIGDNQGWKPAEGVEMEKDVENNIFSITNVVMPNATNWFAFVTVLSEDWAVVNANRYGNADINILNNPSPIAKGELCFTLPAGTYNIAVSFNNMTAGAVEATTGIRYELNLAPATKRIENDQLVIIKNGARYNVLGKKF